MFGLDFIEAFITQTERNLFMKNFIFEMHYNKSLDKRQDERKSFLHWLGQDKYSSVFCNPIYPKFTSIPKSQTPFIDSFGYQLLQDIF